jgi:hypothetical protein
LRTRTTDTLAKVNARSKSRESLRSRERELRALNDWDPIGVAPELGRPTDEYECLLPMIGWLRRGITPSNLASPV